LAGLSIKVLRVPPTHAAVRSGHAPRHRAEPNAGRDSPRSWLEAIVHDLPPAHREILVATYFRRQTTRQAAQQLGITHEEGRRRVYHATRHLAAVLHAARPDRPDELPPTDPGRWRRGSAGDPHRADNRSGHPEAEARPPGKHSDTRTRTD
jgi:hypothetical protein